MYSLSLSMYIYIYIYIYHVRADALLLASVAASLLVMLEGPLPPRVGSRIPDVLSGRVKCSKMIKTR